jgi:hypothetical protein
MSLGACVAAMTMPCAQTTATIETTSVRSSGVTATSGFGAALRRRHHHSIPLPIITPRTGVTELYSTANCSNRWPKSPMR